MANVTIQCCDLCGTPLEHVDGRENGGWGARTQHARKEGLCVEIGFSRGGWGRRETPLNFSGEVCGECFVAAEPVLRAVRDFIRNRGGRKSDQAPLWENQLSPGGRAPSLRGVLRALPGR